MTVYCHVADGIIDNRATFDGALPPDWPDRENWVMSGEAQIGWTFSDGEFFPPPLPHDPPPTNEDVNTERERRIAAGATVTVTGAGAIPVQGRDVDVRNLQGLGLAALARVSAGDTTTITTFRDADNVDHDLTPPQVLELVQRAAGVVEAIITASWAIKAMDPLPADITDDALWPSD